MQNSQKYLYWVALLIALGIGIYVTKWWYSQGGSKTQVEAQILLEHTKNVTKLVTLEGYFSEIYSETDSKEYYYLFSSTKKILLKVKAKVSAGYDLSNMKIEADPAQKVLHITNIPEASIISVEPEISYYDIENGVFNQFTTEDYTRLNKKAIDTIKVQAMRSDFMNTVKKQGVKNFDALRTLAETMGWKVIFDNPSFQVLPQ